MTPTHVVHVDHSGRPGGGQLGLARYLEQPSDLRRSAVFLAGGPVADRVADRADGADDGGAAVRAVLPPGGTDLGPGELRDHLERLRPDLVVCNSMRAAVAVHTSGFRSAPRVTYVRQHLTRDAVGPVKAVLYRAIMVRSDGFLANSRWTADQLPRVAARRPVEIAFPVSGLTRGSVRPLRAVAPGGRGRPVRLAAVGRFQEWKGQDIAIEAVRVLRERLDVDIELHLLGGPHPGSEAYLERCHRLAAAAGVPVVFRGHVGDVAAELAEVDVVLHTPREPEPFGQVLVQALAAGCQVVSTSGGGAAEILRVARSGTALRAPDPEAVADAVARLLAPGRPAGTAQAEPACADLDAFLDDATARGLDEAQERLLLALGRGMPRSRSRGLGRGVRRTS
ncbi:glycosyltransferase family 4 protein [Cellulomonas sp. C5510]|uniref:glycosyltransferase family 4 protein n=1 Tax=Cellulomonas sp. C5510 TaxID=2871170 RepID=UPI001C9468CE|nr:glycosyltransferase family 4 protein [Cellulomonas sp. C5510]QZN84862.1 glycosyltransferase family 4 protein [Cellulomonas sp. C5510]